MRSILFRVLIPTTICKIKNTDEIFFLDIKLVFYGIHNYIYGIWKTPKNVIWGSGSVRGNVATRDLATRRDTIVYDNFLKNYKHRNVVRNMVVVQLQEQSAHQFVVGAGSETSPHHRFMMSVPNMPRHKTHYSTPYE